MGGWSMTCSLLSYNIRWSAIPNVTRLYAAGHDFYRQNIDLHLPSGVDPVPSTTEWCLWSKHRSRIATSLDPMSMWFLLESCEIMTTGIPRGCC